MTTRYKVEMYKAKIKLKRIIKLKCISSKT